MKRASNLYQANCPLNLRECELVGIARKDFGENEAERIAGLIELGVRLDSLFNYRQSFQEKLGWASDLSGPKDPRSRPLETLVGTMSRDLGSGVLSSTGAIEAIGRDPPDPGDLAQLLKIPGAKIEHWLGKVAARENEVLRHPVYQAALAAYEADDQPALGPLIRSVYDFKQDEVRSANHPKRPQFLYHGVKIQPEETAETYVDKIENILRTGLLPSAPGHFNVDMLLRPVFSVPDPAHTHGIAFFKIDLRDTPHTVFIETAMYPAVEGIIYTKRLTAPRSLQLDLRPAEEILNSPTLTEISQHRSPEEMETFRREVLAEIEKRGLEWKPGKIQPT